MCQFAKQIMPGLEENMSAYVLAIRESTTDADKLAEYSREAGSSFAGHAVTPLAAYGQFEVLEGPPIEGAVVLKFPTVAEAKAWYDSPVYSEARKHRLAGAEYRVFIVEGLD